MNLGRICKEDIQQLITVLVVLQGGFTFQIL